MFKTTFNTEYGKIEVTRETADRVGSPFNGVAYFYGLDYETEVDANGHFKGYFGDQFQVSYQTSRGVATARLTRMQPVEIGNANVIPV